jgi:acyl-CoA thioesterase I
MFKKFLITIILVIFCSISNAAENIVVLGDSLSAGYGIDLSKTWVSLLRKQIKNNNLDYSVVNSSVSGSTTAEGLDRLPAVLTKYKPAVVIIELGANDGLRGYPLQVPRTNLAKMIKLVQAKNGKVLLLGIRLPPNYGNAYTAQFQDVYTDLSKIYNVSVVPLFLAKVDDEDKLLLPDKLHPNVQAQPIILKNVWPELKSMLVPKSSSVGK